MAKQERTLEEWKAEVDRLLDEETGCSWADLCGDEEPLKTSYLAGETPQQFVNMYCEKNGLWDIREG
jgi:hypothetical protein